MLGISNLDQILNVPVDTKRITGIFGNEPQHTWCYYFEKASLAAQFGDWQTVNQLYAQVSKKAYTPHDGTEWTPFIQAAAHSGDWDLASQLTAKANAKTSGMGPYFCSVWEKLDAVTPAGQNKDAATSSVNGVLKCSQP